MWSMTSVMTDVPAEREKISQWGRIVAAFGFGMVGMFPTAMDALMQQGVSKKTIYFGGAIIFGIGGMAISMLSSKAKERIKASE